jgi:cytoskeletal protein CcmA (bactofilin family)
VNPYLAVAALVLMVSLMFMLPLVPALAELHRKSDALPLNVVQQNAGDVRHFANGFRNYIKVLEPTLQQCVANGSTASGTLSDGVDYLVLGRPDEALVLALRQPDATHQVLVVAGADLSVPAEATFSQDIYARGHFEGGEKNTYRAILGEKNVHLGALTRVLRWVHAVGEFTADPGCRLYGRISSDSLIHLHANCSFLRLNAPSIEIGDVVVSADTPPPPTLAPAEPGSGASRLFLHDGDFEVQAGRVITSDLVIRGKLRIRSGARIRGSVKSVEDMVIEDGVSVEGSVISARKMRVGPRCVIHGPVVAERELAIAAGSRCGTLEHPTTVSAPTIRVEEGVVVFGTLWAREQGQVAASP